MKFHLQSLLAEYFPMMHFTHPPPPIYLPYMEKGLNLPQGCFVRVRTGSDNLLDPFLETGHAIDWIFFQKPDAPLTGSSARIQKQQQLGPLLETGYTNKLDPLLETGYITTGFSARNRIHQQLDCLLETGSSARNRIHHNWILCQKPDTPTTGSSARNRLHQQLDPLLKTGYTNNWILCQKPVTPTTGFSANVLWNYD